MYDWGVSGIVNLMGPREPALVVTEANTNVMFPRAILPTLKGRLEQGSHILACAVFAGNEQEYCETKWNQPPTLSEENGIYSVHYEGKTIELRMNK